MDDRYSPGTEQITFLLFAVLLLVLAVHLLWVFSKKPEKLRDDPKSSIQVMGGAFIGSILFFLAFLYSYFF